MPTTIGASLAIVGSGRVSTAPTPSNPMTAVIGECGGSAAGDRDDPDGDPDDEQDGERRHDEHDLVGRAERLDRPVLERERHEVDHLLSDGDDW